MTCIRGSENSQLGNGRKKNSFDNIKNGSVKRTREMKRNYSNVVLIRMAKHKDCRAIYSFICDLRMQKLDYDKFKIAYHSNLDNPDIIYLVAELGTELVGFASCVKHMRLRDGGEPIGEIEDVYVLPFMRTMGIEKLLLEKISVAARAKGITRVDVSLDLAPDDDEAESDYDRIAGE